MRTKLDLLVLLGGEDSRKLRSNRAGEIYSTRGGIPILACGNSSGFTGKVYEESEAELMKRHLITQGAREGDILTETKSSDTLENFYFAYPMIPSNLRIGLVTEQFHMRRALWCARKVFGARDIFIPVTVESGVRLIDFVVEGAIQLALMTDLLDIPGGDYESLTRWMQTCHPYYCEREGRTAGKSLYGASINALRKFGPSKALLRGIAPSLDALESKKS